MHRFFIDEHGVVDGRVHISGEDYQHMTKSLRVKIGESVELSNGQGHEYLASVEAMDKEMVILKVLEESENNTEMPVNVALYQGIPKGTKMDAIVQKSVELGASSIVPVIMERTIVEIEKKAQKKVQRWQKIAEEAAKQSKRGMIPTIGQPIDLQQIEGELAKNDLNLVAYEEERQTSLKEILASEGNVKSIGLIVGPEGGLSKGEIQYLKTLGAETMTLGKRILRTETASLAALSMMIYHYELT